jgi:uncharacterized membrane protein
VTGRGHLLAIGYDDPRRAKQLRAAISRLGKKHSLLLLDSALVVRYPDGSVTCDGEPFIAAIHPGGHHFAGFLASLALGVPPLTAAAVSALVGRTGGAAAEVGISDDFIREVEVLMKPGTCALFVLEQEGDLAAMLKGTEGLGGTVLKTNVNVERAKLIQSNLAAAPAGGQYVNSLSPENQQ